MPQKKMVKLMKSSFYLEKETKKKLADFIMKAKILSMGAECAKFEKQFAKKHDRKYAVFVNSGSMANLVLFQALLNLGKIKKGDKVAVSALTWSTNIMPIMQLGLIPVVLDCELETLNISSRTVNELKKGEIKALFLTNALGFAGDISNIRKICKEKNILLLEDNCESLGSKIDGRLLGNFGFASTVSTFVGHHFSTIEGGIVCTDDEKLHDMLLIVRTHGWDRNLSPDKQSSIRKKHKVDDFFSRYTFYDLAFNARPTEVNGFLGNMQIGFLDEIIRKRAENFDLFHRAILKNDDMLPLNVLHMELISNFAMPVICKNQKKFSLYRKKFSDAGVEIRPIIAGDMTKQPFFKKYIPDKISCKNAHFIHSNGFYFPNNPELTAKETALLIKLLEK
jgi:CDP-6-deoxy-D-xylo-4-hexulose-3-dehydrase